MSHRHKSLRNDKSYQKKRKRIKEKQELLKEVKLVEKSEKYTSEDQADLFAECGICFLILRKIFIDTYAG